MLDSVRTRLTLWYAGVLALSLVAFGAVTYYAAAQAFYSRQDDTLRSTAEMVAGAYSQEFEESSSAEQAGDEILKQAIYPHRYVAIVSDEGRVIAASNNLANRSLNINASMLNEARQRGISYSTQQSLSGYDDDGLRVAVSPLSRANAKLAGFVVVAESLGVVADALENLREELLKRMLLNLLDNAVKYTAPGGEVFVSLEQIDDAVVISVRDTGIGIPPEDQPHIFDRFYRVDKARSRRLGGAGLGLSIAHWIAVAHHGEIKVESSNGAGNTFSVILPLHNMVQGSKFKVQG